MKRYYKLSFMVFVIILGVVSLVYYAIASIGVSERSEREQLVALIFWLMLLVSVVVLFIASFSMVRVLHWDKIENKLTYHNLTGKLKRTIDVSQIKKIVLISVATRPVSTVLAVLDEETEDMFYKQLLIAKTGKKVKLDKNILVLDSSESKFVNNFWIGAIEDETMSGVFKVI